jgi:hypothetical protein
VRRRSSSCALVALALLVAAAGAAAGESPAAPDVRAFRDAVNADLGLLASEIVSLDVREMDRAGSVAQRIEATVPRADGPLVVDLDLHSVRASGYRVVFIDGAGRATGGVPSPVNTYRGSVRGVPGSVVAGSILEDGLHLMIDLAPQAGGDRWWLEPLGRFGPEFAGLSVLFRSEDALPAGGRCGLEDVVPGFGADGGGANEVAGGGAPIALGGATCDTTYVAELACDADYEYFADWGGSTESRINSIINSVNAQYESQCEIRHEITTIIIRTSPGAPYTATDAFDLLNQFRNQWLQHHGSIPRDVAHLFTGKNLQGGTIGIAWTIGGICTNEAYCLSESDCCGSFGCATDLTAHELGHLWGATHCDPCSATMRSYIGCFNNFTGGSINQILGHRNSRTCLDGPEPYCPAASATASDEFIANVTIGSIDNDSGADTYSYFACLASDLERGPLHVLTVTLGDASSADIGGAWIDWNQDLDFADEGETLTTSWSGTGPYALTFGIPESAVLGKARLRVRVQDGVAQPFISACGGTDVGEVEDYTVRVVDAEPGPANDACAGAILVGVGSTPFTNLGATTDGPPDGVACDFDGDAQVSSDVWFRFEAPCTAIVTVSVCASSYDTKLAAYETCPVPVQVPAVACNDDACGAGGTRSQLFFGAIEGLEYVIRVGGFAGAQGSGTLTIDADCVETTGACCAPDGTCTIAAPGDCAAAGGAYAGDGTACAPNPCPQPDPCPADIDASGEVDFPDLLAVLSAWGPCAPCPQDIDGSGAVDFPDLLAVLAEWGDCPS